MTKPIEFEFDYRKTRRTLETIPEAYQRTERKLNELFDQCETPEQMTALVRELGEKNEGMAARGMILLACNRMDRLFKTEAERIEMTNQSVAPLTAGGFRKSIETLAGSLLTEWVGADRAGEAVSRVACALASSAACARNPQDFYDCTPQSVASVIAISSLTGIMPSTGRNSLAYAIPRRPRKGEKPQLRYELSHRGVAALVRRSGQSIVSIPISFNDRITTDDVGDVRVESRDIDNPPESMEDLRGVMVVVKDVASGSVTGTGWVAKNVILKRREESDAYTYAEAKNEDWAKRSDPWHKYPIEMAMKTAMHYAVSRGWCVIDDVASVRALQSEPSDSVDDVVEPKLIDSDHSPVEHNELTNYSDLFQNCKDPEEVDELAHKLRDHHAGDTKQLNAIRVCVESRHDELEAEMETT